MSARVWTCQKRTDGRRCGHQNPRRVIYCRACGKAGRPKVRKPAHMKALALTYEAYIAINGGDFCGICGKTRSEGDRRFDRDHDHATGRPRGLLCWACNRQLRTWATVTWLRAAADYLERAATT